MGCGILVGWEEGHQNPREEPWEWDQTLRVWDTGEVSEVPGMQNLGCSQLFVPFYALSQIP
jgi:hypothetical protein